MAKQSPEQLAQEITNQIIGAIENGFDGQGKWTRPWTVSGIFPNNPTTGNPYRGMNAILLMLIGGGHFAGYGQWGDKFKAQVRKGEKSIAIMAPMMRKTGKQDSKGKDIIIPVGFRPVRVFSAAQVDGWEAPVIEGNDAFLDHTEAETTIQRMIDLGLDLRHGGDRAYYSGGQNFVGMPTKSQFPEESDYYATAMHEIIHWTGHSTRLDRHTTGDRFGSNTYAFEELVAELGASILCGELGVHQGYRDDHAKYIGHWLDIMKGDSKAIMDAATLAGKAVDVVMGRRNLKGKDITTIKAEDKQAA